MLSCCCPPAGNSNVGSRNVGNFNIGDMNSGVLELCDTVSHLLQ
jgi:hypothetical protein